VQILHCIVLSLFKSTEIRLNLRFLTFCGQRGYNFVVKKLLWFNGCFEPPAETALRLRHWRPSANIILWHART